MAGRSGGMLERITRHRRVGILERISQFVRALPASDRAIAAVLAIIFGCTSLAALVALERTLMVEVPLAGGSLTEGVVGTPRFVNPLLALTDADRDVTALTYAGLMGEGANGLRPVLAQSYTVSPDGKVYTFTIRKNATFSDGTPVTADDVVFTIQKAQDPGLKSPALANWANIRVDAVDARTVRFTLPKAYAPFLDDATIGILPSHLWKSVPNEQFPFAKLIENPVGAGPFTVTRVVRDKSGAITEYDLKANGAYALGRPYLDGITLKFYPSTDALASAYKNGAIESAYGIAEPGALTAPYSRVFAVFLNPDQNKAFDDIAVRKALSVAVDRSALVSQVLGGYATPLTGPVPPGSGVEEPTLPSGDATAAAKKILTDAGWTYSSSTQEWTNAKEKLSLDPITISTSNVPELKTLATAIQADWQSLGVATSLTFYDPNSLVASVIRPRKYEALFFGMVIGHDDDLFPFWDSSEVASPGLNIALYSNKSVDTLLEKARSETDPVARTGELQQISDAIASDYPAVFTHAPDFVYAVPKSLQGVVLPQITSPSDRFATVEQWHLRTEWVWPIFSPEPLP